MFTRTANASNRSFFLFGPRATGKTTWIRSKFPNAIYYNLLHSEQFLRLSRNPEILKGELAQIKSDDWVVIDEIQRIPELLNEVHDLISLRKGKYVLSGSSARKLKRHGSNLLAGRANTHYFYPLTVYELGREFNLDHALKFGMLPDVWNEPDSAIDILTSYAETYIKEEILQESLIKNLGSFSRFLEVAGIMHGQIINVSNTAQDAQVARQTVQGYFEILEDTLIAYRLAAYKPKLKVKESAHPKFYLFDNGLVNALRGTLRNSILGSADKGFLLETLVLNELRAYNSYNNLGLEFFYWCSGKQEIDFIIKNGAKVFALEVKASERWRSEYSKTSLELINKKIVENAFGIYLGEREFQDKSIRVLPFVDFCKALNQKLLF